MVASLPSSLEYVGDDTHGRLTIHLASGIEEVEIELPCVVDLGIEGDILGLEFLELGSRGAYVRNAVASGSVTS
jgi:hypothetical protein